MTEDSGYSFAKEELRGFIESYEEKEAEKKDVSEQEKEVFAEAKGRGYEPKVIKKVMALRKAGPEALAEEQALIAQYMSDMGTPYKQASLGHDGRNEGELLQFVQRLDALAAEKVEIAEAMKQIMAEAKGRGYDTKAMKTIIAERKRDEDALNEEKSILEIYREALGMA